MNVLHILNIWILAIIALNLIRIITLSLNTTHLLIIFTPTSLWILPASLLSTIQHHLLWVIHVSISTNLKSLIGKLNDIQWSFGKFPSREAPSILGYSHIVKTAFYLIILIHSPSSAFKPFRIGILIDVMLIIQLGLGISWHSFITQLWNHAHVILRVYLKVRIIQHVIWNHSRLVRLTTHHWIIYYHALDYVLATHH